MEFVAEHNLSLYKIAKLANISEGTLRAFRDTPGRHLSAQNFFAVANALEKLTGVKRDYFSLFHDGSLNLPPDYTFFVHPTIADRSSAIPSVGEPPVPEASEDKEIAAEEGKIEGDQDGRNNVIQFLGDNSSTPQALPIRRVRIIRHQHDSSEHLQIRKPMNTTKEFHELIVTDEVIGRTIRPPSLMRSSEAYAVYVPDSQMWPRLEEGDLAYIDPNWPAKANDDVIVYINTPPHNMAFFAQLIGKNTKEIHFGCYTAKELFAVPHDKIVQIHKILRGQELISR
jgi:hypothetical protein